MSGLVKNMYSDVAKSQNFAIFVVRTGCRLTEYSQDIFFTADKAALLRRFYFGSLDRFAKLQERVALFVFIHNQIFSRMRTGENLADSVNNSTRTASVKTAKSAAKQSIFRVSIRTIGRWSDDYKSGAFLSDNYQASSKEEAIGMACEYVKSILPLHSIVASEIKCTLLNPAAL